MTLAKGTKDYLPKDIIIRDKLFEIAKNIFIKYGAVGIKTPVFELYETLMGKYGSDEKLIFELNDQGSNQKLALRYDLTVPLCRYIETHNLTELRRYQIDTVYRRDQPDLSKGRFREFYQCDFDIVGNYNNMLPDCECIAILYDFFKTINIGDFIIKINHRKILDNYFINCGVSQDLIRTVSSSIDKLDKEPWEKVKIELIEKNLSDETISQLYKYVMINGNIDIIIYKLKDLKIFGSEITELTELSTLINYINPEIKYNIEFDLSLARGLDYYTGIIYEVIIKNKNVKSSVAGGGRYDNLIGKLSKRNNIPAVGLSLGIDRIITIMENEMKNDLLINDVVILLKKDEPSNSNESDTLAKTVILSKFLRYNKINVLIKYNGYTKKSLKKLLIKYSRNTKVICLINQIDNHVSVKDMIKKTQNDHRYLNLAIDEICKIMSGKIE